MKQLLTISFLSLVIFLCACGPVNEKATSIKLNLKAEGPFFAGPNSLMASYKPDVKSILGSETAEVKKLSLKKITVSLSDESAFNWSDFNSASLQIVGNNFPMTSVAILNPISTDGNSITLTSSEEAELNELFLEKEFTLILDVDFKDDSYEENFDAELEMNLLFKY